jgi:23S rRNA (cytidine1920-2'-O)/16S rRNA (cytidine1409-2'-O)-methyltransferase
MTRKTRLDLLLVERDLCESQDKAQRHIMAGEVRVDGQLVDKPGTPVNPTAEISLSQRSRYVSRGGEKLDAALQSWHLPVSGWVCADVGACTGGFTDCLLQHGASKVYALDVGKGILHWSLRSDARVVVMEKTNARHVESLPEVLDLVVIDASFISLQTLLPVVMGWLKTGGQIVALVKPQFEAPPEAVDKGGVVRDEQARQAAVEGVVAFANQQAGLQVLGVRESPLRGPAGNVEFLLWLGMGG